MIKYKKIGLRNEEEFLKKKMNELSGGQRQKWQLQGLSL